MRLMANSKRIIVLVRLAELSKESQEEVREDSDFPGGPSISAVFEIFPPVRKITFGVRYDPDGITTIGML